MKEREGKLVVIEGTDGSGKKTQLDLIKVRLEKEGYQVETADFPQYGENRFSEIVGQYLSKKIGSPHPLFAILPFAGDRWMVAPKIRECIKQGIIFIVNRYVPSNLYQAARLPEEEREDFFQFVEELEYGDCQIPREDLVIFLDVPPEIGQEKVDEKGERDYLGGKGRDILEDDKKLLNEVRGTYLLFAQRNDHWVQIDCCDEEGNLLPREEIHQLVYLALQERGII